MAYGAVYLIVNSANGKAYVGQTTTTLAKRWGSHRSHAMHGGSTLLCRALRKHGPDAFTISRIVGASDRATLNAMERFWVGVMGTSNRAVGYNLTTGGEVCQHVPSVCDAKSKAALARFAREGERERHSEALHQMWTREDVRERHATALASYWTDERKAEWHPVKALEASIAARRRYAAERRGPKVRISLLPKEQHNIRGVRVFVEDESTGTKARFRSVSAAARHLNISVFSAHYAMKAGRIVNGCRILRKEVA